MKTLSICAPMYNEKEMVPYFFEKIDEVVKKISSYKVEILIVNDGSKDNTLELLKEQKKTHPNLHIVSFSRNFGHEAAVSALLKYSKGDVVCIMDSDLQDPPELIIDMLKLYEQGFDVVNARRINRKKDPFLKRITAELFYKVISKLSGKIKVPDNVGNYRLLSRQVVDHINNLKEKNSVFRVQVPYVGFKTATVDFVRPPRLKGETHYNYKSMFKLAGDSITSSSTQPLRWSLYLGIILGTISFISFIVFLILRLVGFSTLIYFEAMLYSFIVLTLSIVLIVLGVVGEYVGRILIETQNRPLYYVEEEIKGDLDE